MSDPTDPRIETYRRAATELESGRFPVEFPVGGADEIGELGLALAYLADHIEHLYARTHALRAVGDEVAGGVLLEDVCDRVYEAFAELIPYDRIGLALIDEGRQTVTARWGRAEGGATHLRPGYTARLEGSSLQGILDTGEPRILNDLREYLELHPGSHSTKLVLAEGYRSSLTCPLLLRGRPVGFLFFSSCDPHCYEDVHVELFQQIASQLSAVVEKTRLYEDLLALTETKNKFLGMAAHDMRSPLMVIRGWTEMLQLGHPETLPESVQPILGHIDRAAEQLLGLVEDLLDLSVVEAGELNLSRETLDLSAQVQRWDQSASLMARAKGIGLTLDLPAEAVVVVGDPRRLDQVLTNLGSNAVKFSAAGAVVTVSLREEAAHAVLTVADQGVGIPADELPKLFTEFGRTSAQPTGGERSIGLGLAITRRVVEAHGGTITARSEVGVGTTFEVRLHLPSGSPPAPT